MVYLGGGRLSFNVPLKYDVIGVCALKQETLTLCWFNVGPASNTIDQYQTMLRPRSRGRKRRGRSSRMM